MRLHAFEKIARRGPLECAEIAHGVPEAFERNPAWVIPYKCTSCGICVKACPHAALEIVEVAVPPVRIKSDLPPTIANYQRVAAKSLDELDDLLTAQSKHHASPAPIYTASLFGSAHPID